MLSTYFTPTSIPAQETEVSISQKKPQKTATPNRFMCCTNVIRIAVLGRVVAVYSNSKYPFLHTIILVFRGSERAVILIDTALVVVRRRFRPSWVVMSCFFPVL